jgi:hypothetical protein
MSLFDEHYVDRELLRFAVQRAIFCPVSKVVLDVRTAVLVDARDTGKGMAVMTADVFDERKAALDEQIGTYTVVDGRTLRW